MYVNKAMTTAQRVLKSTAILSAWYCSYTYAINALKILAVSIVGPGCCDWLPFIHSVSPVKMLSLSHKHVIHNDEISQRLELHSGFLHSVTMPYHSLYRIQKI